MNQLLMGIDIGTSSVKTLITNLMGETIALAQENYGFAIPKIGYAEQDMENVWSATVNTIRSAINSKSFSPKEISGIGFSGQMHGLVILNKDNQPIRPAIIWADQRSKKQIEWIQDIGYEKEIEEITFNPLCSGFFLPSLLWIRDNEPNNYKNIKQALLPKDYIRYRMCGTISTDYSDASGTLLFDIKKGEWASTLLNNLNIDNGILPQCFPSIKIVGSTTTECFEATGLPKGIPIICGGGDQPMQSLGNGIIHPGDISSNIGTASQISCSVNHPIYDEKLRVNTFCHVPQNTWMVVGASLNGGGTLRWLRDNVIKTQSYVGMDKLAETVQAGSDGLVFLPYLVGERSPHLDPNAKGIVYGLNIAHAQAHIIRAVMEGIVFSLRDSFEVFKRMNIPCRRIVASGGGAKSSLWLQLQADILGKEIYTTGCEQEACYGAAIAASIGIGAFSGWDTACASMIHYCPVVTEPIQENVSLYNEQFSLYQRIYQNNKELFAYT